jgi:hypothetical protein
LKVKYSNQSNNNNNNKSSSDTGINQSNNDNESSADTGSNHRNNQSNNSNSNSNKDFAATGINQSNHNHSNKMETRVKVLETALQELGDAYDSAMRQVVACKKLLSTEQETIPDKKNGVSSFGSLEAADHMCALLKETLLSLEKDTDLLRSRLCALKGDAAPRKEKDNSGSQEMETRLKLIETALQELGEVYDSSMRQTVDCKKLR